MKCYRIIAAAFAAFVAAAPFASGVTIKGVVRPYVALVSPTADDYDDKSAVGFSAGCAFGNEGLHELTLDISRAKWSHKESYQGVTASGSETWMPVLLNYRHYIPTGNPKLRPFINPAIGFTRYTLKARASGYGQNVSASDSPWAMSVAVGAGLSFSLSANASIDVGYRYLYISDTDANILGTKIEGEAAKAHTFYVAVGIKF